MRVNYKPKEQPDPNPIPQEISVPETDWTKLGYNNKPDPKPEEFEKPGKPDVPGLLPDQSPKQISPLHDEINVSSESTFINQQIKSKQECFDWILSMLGYPLVTAELTEVHLNTALSNAIQLYTEYAYFPDQYILEYLSNYEPGKGINLSKYNVAGVTEISVGTNSLMFYDWPFMMNRAGYQGSGTLAGSFITFHNMVEFREMVTRLCALEYDFNYSRFTKYLTLFPDPTKKILGAGDGRGIPMVMTVQVEPPLWELYGDRFVRAIALANAKIILGQIRSKFQGITLPGGGNISADILSEGKEELEKLEEKLKSDRAKGQSWFFT